MADHYVSIQRGVEGFAYNDFRTGTSDTLTDLFAFRVHDGVTPSRTEIIKALEAFRRFFENVQQVSAAGFDVGG
jgi:hypothetical protein